MIVSICSGGLFRSTDIGAYATGYNRPFKFFTPHAAKWIMYSSYKQDSQPTIPCCCARMDTNLPVTNYLITLQVHIDSGRPSFASKLQPPETISIKRTHPAHAYLFTTSSQKTETFSEQCTLEEAEYDCSFKSTLYWKHASSSQTRR